MSRNGTLHFSAQAWKIKKSTPRKTSYTSGNPSGLPKKILMFFSKESCSYISENGNLEENLLNIKKNLYFRKRNFLIFRERYIQNPSIFRTRSIFRTLVYLEPETYSEQRQSSAMECFAKNSYLAQFLIFSEMKLSWLIFLLYFRK